MEIDPVCGMEVDPATAAWKGEYRDTTYYFCAKGCMTTSRRTQTYMLG